MAISRIPGYSLLSNLDRQGIDLQFTTNSNSLVYMDFANFRFGINTVTPQHALEVVGNVFVNTGHILTSSNVTYDLGTSTNYFRSAYANTVNSTYLAGTITTAAQPNITSVGTLSSLSVTGNIVSYGNIIPSSNVVGGLGSVTSQWKSLYANLVYATGIYGTVLTTNQPNITNLANINLTNITVSNLLTSPTANITTLNSTNINGTIITANQPNITNLGNITVNSISIAGNLTLSGNINKGNIYADALYDSSYRVLTTNTAITVTGADLTGSGKYNNVAVALTTTGVSASSYGNTTTVPNFTVDNKGRITAASNTVLTRIGNITVNDSTVSSSSNLVLSPSTKYIFASNSIISNVANPVNQQDAVTLNYLQFILNTAISSIFKNDTSIAIVDSNAASGYISTIVDGSLVSNTTSAATTVYNTFTAGNLSINDRTITSTGNIYLDAQTNGVVQIVGSDAIGMPFGTSAFRPLNPEVGYTRFNTEYSTLEYFNGVTWTYPGINSVTSETINPDGINSTYTLSINGTADSMLVSINGTLQSPSVAYTVIGNQITFTEVPGIADIVEIRHIAAGTTLTLSKINSGTTVVDASPSGNVNVTGNIIPSTTSLYNLGHASNYWDNLYANVSYISTRVASAPTVLIATGNIATTIDSYSATTYRTAKYIIQSNTSTRFESVEVLVTHNSNANAYSTVYGIVNSGNSLGNVSATLANSVVSLRYTPSNNNTTLRISKTYIPV